MRHNGRVTLYRWRVLLWIVMLLAVALLGWRARSALMPFAFGAVLAYALTPLVDRLALVIPARSHQGDVVRRGIVVFVLYVIMLGALGGAGALIVPTAVDQITEFVDTLPTLVDEAREQSNEWLARYRSSVPAELQDRIDALAEDGANAIAAAVASWMRGSASFVTQTLTVLLTIVVVPIWMFWALRDRHFVARNFLNAVPASLRRDVENVLMIGDQLLGRYIRGQLLLGLVVGIAVTVGLTFMGVQLSVALGVWAGLTELIPIIGPWLGAIPGLLIVLATDPGLFVWVALLYILVQQLENNLLVPRIQGHAVDIHPAMVILLLAVGGSVFGFLGLLVAVPMTAILRELFWYVDRRLRGQGPEEALVSGKAGRLARRGEESAVVATPDTARTTSSPPEATPRSRGVSGDG